MHEGLHPHSMNAHNPSPSSHHSHRSLNIYQINYFADIHDIEFIAFSHVFQRFPTLSNWTLETCNRDQCQHGSLSLFATFRHCGAGRALNVSNLPIHWVGSSVREAKYGSRIIIQDHTGTNALKSGWLRNFQMNIFVFWDSKYVQYWNN